MRTVRQIGLALAAVMLVFLGCGGGGGSTPAPVVQAPSALAYATNPAIYTKGSSISSNLPSSAGGAVTTYGVSPALPGGLNLNAATGAISGTPTTITSQATYVVTGANSGGSASCTLNRPVFLGQMVECIHAAAPVPRRF